MPKSLAVCSSSYCIPDCLRAFLISLANICEEAITEPAPFLEDRVSLSLVVLSLKCVAAAKILLKRVFASLCEENWAGKWQSEIPGVFILVVFFGLISLAVKLMRSQCVPQQKGYYNLFSY